jgi:TetR/AcrR family transcriptional repressor of nem operon
MARQKNFEVEKVLDRAMEVFWLKGYHGTTLQDLLAGMGIKRQSLYDTFGDKHALFLQTLERYYQELADEGLTRLEAPEASLATLREFLEGLLAFQTSPGARRACLIANSASELAIHDEQVAEHVRRFTRRLEAGLKNALENAVRFGELRQDADPAGLSKYMVTFAMGMSLVAKSGFGNDDMKAATEQALSVLG